ncbi:MAG: family 1 glycosylhydrolase [Eubacteriales bacterium]|nr:family 1 glycosylhydrolase [Eubacteriales bacterium]
MGKFAADFLVGTATAAHQVEGNNIHSDYWALEQMKYGNFAEPSLDAVDHYNRYEEDIRLMAEAGLNAYRFSIEWARIEPEKGIYDAEAIDHYRNVLHCCRTYGLEPIVTMHHITSPKWLISEGGWENEETVSCFAKYCAYVVEMLGEQMHYVCTINEANMGIQSAAIAERYMRQMKANMEKQNLEGTAQIGMNFNSMMENMQKQKAENLEVFGCEKLETFVSPRTPEGDLLVIKAHIAAKEAMKAVKPELKIGLSLSLHDIQTVEGGEAQALKEWQDEFAHYVPYIKEDDFIGLQNYSRTIIGAEGYLPVPAGNPVTQMGYENYPQALEHVIRRVYRELQLPIMVTENGIATDNDAVRTVFIEQATDGVVNCLTDGIPVIGYMYWSLLDNFEWQKGFSMTFGLIAVDRSTQTRFPKESLRVLGSFHCV